jgi:hypothetical protein
VQRFAIVLHAAIFPEQNFDIDTLMEQAMKDGLGKVIGVRRLKPSAE